MSPYQSDALTAWLSRYSTQSRIRTHAFSVCNTEALTRLSYSGKDRWVVERGKLPPIDPVGTAGFEPAATCAQGTRADRYTTPRWSEIPDSNRRPLLGRQMRYHYANLAWTEIRNSNP